MQLAGHGVEAVLDDREADRSHVEVGAFGQPASQQAIGLLVGGALPRRARLTEVHLRAGGVLDVSPAGHLASLVPGQGLEEVSGLAAESGGHGVGGAVGVVAVGKGHRQGLAAEALDEGRDR